MNIADTDDARQVESHIRSVFDARSDDDRAAALRRMLVETLDFHAAYGEVSLAGAPSGVSLPERAYRVGWLDGVHALYARLSSPDGGRVRKAEASAAASIIAKQLGDDLLLVFSDADVSRLHFIHPDFSAARPALRRVIIERDLPRRTAIQQLSNIYRALERGADIRAALEDAFDVEPVTKRFFAEYKRVFESAERGARGFAPDEAEDRRMFVQTLFNRLMFVYFLSRKGWLSFGGDKDYLNALWHDYRERDGGGREGGGFHRDRLRPLFFGGLNNPRGEDLTDPARYPAARALIGDVPFLNGGLFEETDLDRRWDADVPDAVLESVLSDLFDKFNFTVMESTPFDVEVAVDPEMLGKVFEELVTGRHDSGAYYTPRAVVSFMCREALKGYLEGADVGAPPDAVAAFVDERDVSAIPLSAARAIGRALDEVTVIDPACGSGAYLLGMMQELVELQTALYNAVADPRSLYDLKLHVISRSLYGADSDDFAVNIAMLRMWLSLAIEYEGDVPEPLPNLDFKIARGDSLLAPDPSAANYGDLFRHRIRAAADNLAALKARHMSAVGPDKSALKDEVETVQRTLADALAESPAPEGATDWRVEFAEVFARGGFDIALANPPYVQLQKDGGRLRNLYKGMAYRTFSARGDVYQLFYERGCQLLAPRGLLAYVTSNSWMKAQYGAPTRRYFAENHAPIALLDLGKDVFESAVVDSSVLFLRVGERGGAFPAVDMDALPNPAAFPPDKTLWGQIRPDAVAPWSVLSPAETRVMDKMRAVGTPLKEWDVSIYRGVTSGLNEAFVIDGVQRRALIEADPKSADIIKPVLRGRDIKRWRAKWAGLYLIDTHNGYGNVPNIDVDDYPSVKERLDAFYPRLARRLDKGRTPYNLRSCAYHEEFAKEKLFWMDLTDRGRFAYDDGEMFCVNTAFTLTGESLKYLCAALNSTLATWFMRNAAMTSGMGVTRWIVASVEQIPIPQASASERSALARLADEILRAKAADADADVGELEREADRLVYDLYGLTPDETAAVERAAGG